MNSVFFLDEFRPILCMHYRKSLMRHNTRTIILGTVLHSDCHMYKCRIERLKRKLQKKKMPIKANGINGEAFCKTSK